MPARFTISKTWLGPTALLGSGGVQPHGLGASPGAPSRVSPRFVVNGWVLVGLVTTVLDASPDGTYPGAWTMFLPSASWAASLLWSRGADCALSDCKGRSFTFTDPTRCACPLMNGFWLVDGAARTEGITTNALKTINANRAGIRMFDNLESLFGMGVSLLDFW